MGVPGAPGRLASTAARMLIARRGPAQPASPKTGASSSRPGCSPAPTMFVEPPTQDTRVVSLTCRGWEEGWRGSGAGQQLHCASAWPHVRWCRHARRERKSSRDREGVEQPEEGAGHSTTRQTGAGTPGGGGVAPAYHPQLKARARWPPSCTPSTGCMPGLTCQPAPLHTFPKLTFLMPAPAASSLHCFSRSCVLSSAVGSGLHSPASSGALSPGTSLLLPLSST